MTRTDEDIHLSYGQSVKLHGVFDVKDGKLRAWGADGQPSPTLYTDLTASRSKLGPAARSRYMPDDGDAGPFAVMESPPLMARGFDRQDWNLSKPIRWAIEGGCELPYLSITVLPMTIDNKTQTGSVQFSYDHLVESAKDSLRADRGESLTLGDVYVLVNNVEEKDGKTTYTLSIQGLGVGQTLDLKVESVAVDGKPSRDTLVAKHWDGSPTTPDLFRVSLVYPTTAKVLTFLVQASRGSCATRYGIPLKPTSDVMKPYAPEPAKKPLSLDALARTNKDLQLDPRKSVSVVGLYDVRNGNIRVWDLDGKLNGTLQRQLEEARPKLRPEARAKYLPKQGNAGPFAAVFASDGVIVQNSKGIDRAQSIPVTTVFARTRKSFCCTVQILPLIEDSVSHSGAVRIDYSFLSGPGSMRGREDYAEMLADPGRQPIMEKRNHPLTPVTAVLRYGLPAEPK